MNSRPLATWTAAILVVVLATAISHDAWLFLVPTAAALVVAGVVARAVSNQWKK